MLRWLAGHKKTKKPRESCDTWKIVYIRHENITYAQDPFSLIKTITGGITRSQRYLSKSQVGNIYKCGLAARRYLLGNRENKGEGNLGTSTRQIRLKKVLESAAQNGRRALKSLTITATLIGPFRSTKPLFLLPIKPIKSHRVAKRTLMHVLSSSYFFVL